MSEPKRIPYDQWINSQLSIARFYGGCTINGVKYELDYDNCRTEVSLGEYDLTNDHNTSLTEMLVQSYDNFNLQLKPNRLYMLDQECVHRPTVNKTNDSVLRTFIKVTYSKELFNCIGNAWNYKLPHIKPNKHRFEHRNHSVV